MSLGPPKSLFSNDRREDAGPAPYTRGEYEALNESADPMMQRQREQLDQWFRGLPPAAAAEIYERFRRRDDMDHRGAFFEMYLHRLAVGLGAKVRMDVGSTSSQRRPDFTFTCGGGRVHLEATAVLGAGVLSPVDQRRRDLLYDLINSVDAPAFAVWVDVLEQGEGEPGRRAVTARLQRAIDGLDPDELLAVQDAPGGGRGHPVELRFGGWNVLCTIRGLEPRARDYPGHRVVGSRFDGACEVDDITPLRRKLKDKASRYGQFDEPYVIAVLCAGTFAGDDDVQNALFGRIAYETRGPGDMRRFRHLDGVWTGPRRPVNTRLSGVLAFRRLNAFNVAQIQPTLWTNPWAANPLDLDQVSFRVQQGLTSGEVMDRPAKRTVAEILSLPENWPESHPLAREL